MALSAVEPPVVPPTTRKESSMRKWGPAVLALGMALVMHAILFQKSEIPSVTSDRSRRKLALISDRVAAMDRMEEAFIQQMGLMGQFGGRDRNGEEDDSSVVLQYTRRRHRYLGDQYTHQDKSGDFTSFGKITTCLIYLAFWVFLLAFPDWPLPIGRPGIALGGGLSMIVWRYILLKTEHGPYFDAERVIIVEPLFLLFGLMLTTIYIEKMDHGGLFDKLRASLDDPINWKRSFKIMLLSTIGSAALMNDSVVLIFSGAVAELCLRHKVANSLPYLLSMATSANIGSALTKTGNSHNFLIVTLAYDDIDWIEFFLNMGLPVLAASVVNATLLSSYYSDELFPGASGIGQILCIMFAGYRTPEMLAQERAYSEFKARRSEMGDDEIVSPGWSVWAKIQLFVTMAFLIFLALGYNVCVVSIVAGGMLMVISAYKRKHHDRKPPANQHDDDGNPLGSEAEPAAKKLALESETTLVEIDYGLLLLFIGQFLLTGSFVDTGVPQHFINWSLGSCADDMTGGACVYGFVTMVALVSNIVGGLSTCQILAATFPFASPYDWLHVSYAVTIAGNLTMLGSAANMIIAHQAARVDDHTFTAPRHASFGFPSTLFCLYMGAAILAAVHFSPECSVKLGECGEGFDAGVNPSIIHQWVLLLLLTVFIRCLVVTQCVFWCCRGFRHHADKGVGAPGSSERTDEESDLQLFQDAAAFETDVSVEIRPQVETLLSCNIGVSALSYFRSGCVSID